MSVFQSSLLAPAPLARFSSSSPLLMLRVSGSSASERVIPEASTPSQLFAPCVSCTSFRLAPAAPTPPALDRGVERQRERLRARERSGSSSSRPAELASSRLPVPVAVKTPLRVTVAVPEMWRSRLLSKPIVGRVMPGRSGVSVFQSSLLAPIPLARFSLSSPLLIASVSGSSASERVMPEASTPSQLFAPCVS